LAPFLPEAGPPWTAGLLLPGGEDLPDGGIATLAAELAREHPFLAEATAERLAGSYGSEARNILCEGPSRDFGQGLSEAELRWLVEHEWARTAEDVLWRRTKLGLRVTAAEARDIADYLARLTQSAPVPAGAASLPTEQTA